MLESFLINKFHFHLLYRLGNGKTLPAVKIFIKIFVWVKIRDLDVFNLACYQFFYWGRIATEVKLNNLVT